MVSMKGILWFFGPPSKGKTTTALMSCDNAKKIGFIDCDNAKGEGLAEQLGIEHYSNMAVLGQGLEEYDYHKVFMSEIAALPDDLELIVVDAPKRMMIGSYAYVKKHAKEFRSTYANYGPIHIAQQWQDVKHMHLPDIYATLRGKADLVIFVTHEKQQIKGEVFTGRMEPDADSSLLTAAGVVVRLMPDLLTGSRAPVGLVIKHPDGKVDLKTKRVLNVFPNRIAPFDWPTINGYLADPFEGRDQIAEHETPNEQELAIINGSLTPDEQANYDLRLAVQALKVRQVMAEDVIELAASMEHIKPLLMAGRIATELKVEYPSITISDVQDVLNAVEKAE